jgi:hypothetical protein
MRSKKATRGSTAARSLELTQDFEGHEDDTVTPCLKLVLIEISSTTQGFFFGNVVFDAFDSLRDLAIAQLPRGHTHR